MSGTGTSHNSVVGLRVDRLTRNEATKAVLDLARARRSSYVCLANVHMTMEAVDDPTFRAIVNEADLVLPDGMPLAWGLGLLTRDRVERVRGPDLFLSVARQAEHDNIPVALYGGTETTLETLRQRLQKDFPRLQVSCAISPPFRELSAEEDEEYCCQIKASGARILMVGLGCPKQERWMAMHRPRLPLVMLGVGAAFDFYAGNIREAPLWIQRSGFEWMYRLLHEPQRLWRRYARHNPRFIMLFLQQLWSSRRRSHR